MDACLLIPWLRLAAVSTPTSIMSRALTFLPLRSGLSSCIISIRTTIHSHPQRTLIVCCSRSQPILDHQSPRPHPHAHLNPPFPPRSFGPLPLACCLLTTVRVCPFAAPAALFAFSAFFFDSAAAFFSLASLTAALRAARRASGRWARRSLITSRDAPTMARWCLTVRRVRFLAISYPKSQSSARVYFPFPGTNLLRRWTGPPDDEDGKVLVYGMK